MEKVLGNFQSFLEDLPRIVVDKNTTHLDNFYDPLGCFWFMLGEIEKNDRRVPAALGWLPQP